MPSRGGSRPKVTAAGRPSPVQTRRKHAKFPGQHGHIHSQAVAAETALTRSNDGQIQDGHDVAGHQDTYGLATGARRPAATLDLAGAVVAGGPLSPLSVPLFPGARVFRVSSAGECPKTHDFV